MSSPALPYWRLSSFYFCYYAALGGFTPYFSQWLHDLGQDAAAISLLMAMWYATRIAAPALWSAGTARSSHPIRWLRAGAMFALAGFAGFLLARDLAWLLLVMLVFGFFFNAVMPQFEALTLDTLGPRRADYSRLRVWGSIGFIAVTLGYGAILERTGSGALPLLMLPLFAATALSAFVNRMPDVAPVAHAEAAPSNAWHALRRTGALPFLAVAMLMQIGFGPYYVFFTLHLGEQGFGTGVIGGLWALGVLAEIVLFVFAPRLLHRFGATSLLLFCLAATAVRWLVTAWFAHLLWLMLPLQLLHALSYGIFHAACMQLIGVYFPGRLGAHGQALLYAVGLGLGGVLGALLAGTAWEIGGGQASFAAGALAAAVGFALALRLRGRPAAFAEPPS